MTRQQHMTSVSYKTKDILWKLLTLFVVVISAMALVFHLSGFRWYIVVSGSMSPAVPSWSLAIIDINVDSTEILTKDIIMYDTDKHQTPVLHRVMEATESGFVTKGDQNITLDPEVPLNQVIGVYTTHIPFIGKILYWIQQTYLLLLCVIGLSMTYMFLKSRQERSRGYEKITSDPH